LNSLEFDSSGYDFPSGKYLPCKKQVVSRPEYEVIYNTGTAWRIDERTS